MVTGPQIKAATAHKNGEGKPAWRASVSAGKAARKEPLELSCAKGYY